MLTIHECSVKNFKKDYGNHEVVLRSLVMDEQITIIKGANGSGKSTLLKAMASLTQYEGQIQRAKRVGFMHEEVSFPMDISLMDFLDCLAQVSKTKNVKKIDHLIDLFSLRDKLKEPIRKLSKGMKMKVNILQCLMEEKDLYLLDEPFNGLDQKSVESLIAYMKKEKHKQFILTSHIFFDATLLDCKVIIL